MLNDKPYREFKNQPFEETYDGKQEVEEFRETLMIDEIMKCGQEILGSIGISINDDQQETAVQESSSKRNSKRTSSQRAKRQKSKFIYEYDYGKQPQNKRKYTNQQSENPTEEVSFTLSNDDNRPQNNQHSLGNYQKPRQVQWKTKLLEQEFDSQRTPTFNSFNNFKELPNPKATTAKNFERPGSAENPKKNQNFQIKNQAKQITLFSKKTQLPLGSSKPDRYQSASKQQKYKTPQKMTKIPNQTLKVPLSEQITKNIYGKLKTEVEDKTFLEEYEFREKQSKQEKQSKWKDFILRSEKWTEDKKNHLIQMQMTEKYSSPKKSRSKSRNHLEYGYNSGNQKPNYQVLKFHTVRNDVKFPQRTLKNKNHSPEKRESSVQNCINKLKTQTELLKVKLLSPLKQKINDNTEIEHYKQINESQSRKSIKRYRQNYEEKPFAKTASTLIQIKHLYGKCIGQRMAQ